MLRAMALKKTISSGTFASKPSSPTAGTTYLATDIGAGTVLVYTGSKWKPMGGYAMLSADSTVHTGSGTGSEANYHVVTIPAGLLSSGGGLRFYANMTATGTTGTKTITIRHNTTSGAVTGGTLLINSAIGGGTTTLCGFVAHQLFNSGATNSQITPNSSFAGFGGAVNTAALTTGSIDTSAVSYLNFNINGNAADTVGYQGVYVEWIEP